MEKPSLPMGRPKKEIDSALFERLCKAQCTEVEICDFFEVSEKTLITWCRDTYGVKGFKEAANIFRNKGKAALRLRQWQQAKKFPSMSVWLGKQWLGQSEKPTGEVSKVVIVKDDIEQRLAEEGYGTDTV